MVLSQVKDLETLEIEWARHHLCSMDDKVRKEANRILDKYDATPFLTRI